MPDAQGEEPNTIAMLGRAYSLLGFRIVDGVVGAGYPQKPSHSAVFAQIDPKGSRLTDLARRANMTPQAMGELVDELEGLGYVVRRPDPTDRRAKLIVLTERGQECIAAGLATIDGLEQRITDVLGDRGRQQLRRLLQRLLDAGEADDRGRRRAFADREATALAGNRQLDVAGEVALDVGPDRRDQ